MKKLICMFLAFMMMFGLMACGTDETTVANSETDTKQSVEVPTEDADEATEVEEPEDEPKTDLQAKLPDFDTSPTIEETVLVDQDDIKIVATGLEYGGYGLELKLSLENNSDEALTFSTSTIGYSGNSINGFMVQDGYFSSDIEPGKKAIETVDFSYQALQLFGINEIADIALGIRVTNEDYEDTIYPDCEIKTSIADSYEYDPLAYQTAITSDAAQNTFRFTTEYFTAETLYDSGDVQIVSADFMVNQDGDRIVLLEAVNNGSEEVMLGVTGVGINGLTIFDGNWSNTTISPDKRGVVNIGLDDILNTQYWDAYGLDEITSIDIKLGLRDGWEVSNEEIVHIPISEDAPLNLDGNELYNQNGIRIISKGVLGHEYNYDSNLYLALLIENETDKDYDVDVQYDSLSVNDMMITEFGSGNRVPAHSYGVLIVDLYGSDLEDADITDVDQIQKVECVIEFGESYNTEFEAPIVAEF